MAIFLLYATLFVMFFQPVYVWPVLEAWQPLRNLAIAALVAFLFAGGKSQTGFFSSKINRYFLFFVVWQSISSGMIWSGAMIETINLWLRMGIVYYLITKSITSERRLNISITMIVMAIVYLVYYSIDQFVLNYQPGMRAGGFGWYENSNDLAIILVSVIPLSLLLAHTSRAFLLKVFYYVLSGSFAFTILFTGSRNGLLGLLTVVSLSLMSLRNVSGIMRTIMMVLIVGAVASVGITNVLSRSDLNGLSGDDSSEDRIEQWKAGVRMVVRNPLFGVGRGEFDDSAVDYGGIRNLQPHNTIIQVVSETGIPGGIAFILFAFQPLIEIRRLGKQKNDRANPKIMMYAQFISVALIGFWVCAFFSNRYQFYILYVLVAILVAIKHNILYVGDNVKA